MRVLTIPFALILALTAHATPTVITVRAVSHDAKILGDHVGGAKITIRNAETGQVLASGLQTGNTGDTAKIMKEPRARGAAVYDTEGAAAFRATLDLDCPTRIEISAEGPLKFPQATQKVTRTMLVVPGANIGGEGVLLEIAGLIVDVAPIAAEAGKPVAVRAKVTMSCGCPTEPGGMWDADHIAITARVSRGGTLLKEVPLRYAGQTSTYEGALTDLSPGAYSVEVLASDPGSGNFGHAVVDLMVPAK